MVAPVKDMTAAGLRSGKFSPVSGIPTQLLVLHSAECPLRGGFAQSLTEWASSVYPKAPEASWQRFVDPIARVRFIPDNLGAWHASEANPMSIGWEQAGYARFTRAEWLTPDGLKQLDNLAYDMAEVALRDGIPPVWLTNAQVNAVTAGNRNLRGFCTHRQIDPDRRTDPGDGYPYDLLMARVVAYMKPKKTGGTVGALTTETEIQEYAKDGKTEAGVKTLGFIIGQLNQWFTRVMDKQDLILKGQTAILKAINANKAVK